MAERKNLPLSVLLRVSGLFPSLELELTANSPAESPGTPPWPGTSQPGLRISYSPDSVLSHPAWQAIVPTHLFWSCVPLLSIWQCTDNVTFYLQVISSIYLILSYPILNLQYLPSLVWRSVIWDCRLTFSLVAVLSSLSSCFILASCSSSFRLRVELRLSKLATDSFSCPDTSCTWTNKYL